MRGRDRDEPRCFGAFMGEFDDLPGGRVVENALLVESGVAVGDLRVEAANHPLEQAVVFILRAVDDDVGPAYFDAPNLHHTTPGVVGIAQLYVRQ